MTTNRRGAVESWETSTRFFRGAFRDQPVDGRRYVRVVGNLAADLDNSQQKLFAGADVDEVDFFAKTFCSYYFDDDA